MNSKYYYFFLLILFFCGFNSSQAQDLNNNCIKAVEHIYDKIISSNDIARISIRVTQPLFIDKYRKNRVTGSVIIIDENTHNTIGAGMII